jgi:uncharacterized protein (DUF1800 family)
MVPLTLDTSTDPQVGFRPPGALDAATALTPYTGPFGARHAAHLLRRAGFGGSSADIDRSTTLGMAGSVDRLLHPRDAEPSFPDYPPADILYEKNRGLARTGTQRWWLDRMLRTQHPLHEKMTLFWHGHFATSIAKVPAALMARQIDLFRAQGLGNFRTLLAAVSTDPAMSVWLDNRSNTKAHPNENYAREVMELFALGLGAYTEDDVKAGARALTGWGYDRATMTVAFDPRRHDDGIKTFLGRTGPFGLTDVVDIIVEQPIHQRFIARKLLEFFVYSDPEPELTEAVAATYALSGYDIAKTVGTILRSQVFYSTRAYRALPKSPLEFTIGLLRFTGATSVPARLPAALRRMGQEPLAPPSVKGWDGGPTWINTNTLLARFNFVNALVATSGVTAPRATAASPMTAGTMTAGAMTAGAMTAGSLPAAPTAAPNIAPDRIVARAGGMDPERIIATIVSDALQDDVTSDVRATLVGFLNATDTGATAPSTMMAAPATQAAPTGIAFGPENYQEKVRGALALALNLPVNQLN